MQRQSRLLLCCNGIYKLCITHCRSDALQLTVILDVESDMKAMIDSRAISELTFSAERIWGLVNEHFYKSNTDTVVRGLTRNRVHRRVYRAGRVHFGGNIHGQIELPLLPFVQGSMIIFSVPPCVFWNASGREYRGARHWLGESRTDQENEAPWCHNFSDGTLRSVPRSFYQCVIIMVYDDPSDCFLPVFYVLCTSKSSNTYWNVVHHVI